MVVVQLDSNKIKQACPMKSLPIENYESTYY